MAKTDLLYISFIDLESAQSSGSGIRPKMMRKALEAEGLKLKVLDGENNNRRQRQIRVREIMDWLDGTRPDFCYIEPPAGPIFNSIDRALIKKIHEMGIISGLFYRDAYWKFPDRLKREGLSLKDRLIQPIKNSIIINMCKRDLALYKENISQFFVPSKSFAALVGLENSIPLPPASDYEARPDQYEKESKRIKNNKVLNFFYVGSIINEYGGKLLLDSFAALNKDESLYNLILVCPKDQWESPGFSDSYQGSWLKVRQASMGAGLEELYDQADVCLLAQRQSSYNDIAVNVKIFEYFANRKPVLTTSCFEISQIMKKYDAGWLSQDRQEDLIKKIIYINENRQEVLEKKDKAIEAAKENTWRQRAGTMMDSLISLKK